MKTGCLKRQPVFFYQSGQFKKIRELQNHFSLRVSDFFDGFGQFAGENKFIHFFVIRTENIVDVTFPPFLALVKKKDLIPYFEH